MVPLPCDVPRRTTTVGRKVQSSDGTTLARLARAAGRPGVAARRSAEGAGTPRRLAPATAPAGWDAGPWAAIASGPLHAQRLIPTAATSGHHAAALPARAGPAPARRRFAPMIDRGSFPDSCLETARWLDEGRIPPAGAATTGRPRPTQGFMLTISRRPCKSSCALRVLSGSNWPPWPGVAPEPTPDVENPHPGDSLLHALVRNDPIPELSRRIGLARRSGSGMRGIRRSRTGAGTS
jgi:hypothetical protein